MEKSYPEINEIASQDGSILVVPVGSVEQHGHHLPVGTDTFLVDAVAHKGAERVTKDVPILVTPAVWSGFSPHHLPFGGTITLDYDELQDSLSSIVDSAVDYGFNAVLLLNGHGGNATLIDGVVKKAGNANPDVEMLGLTYFNLAQDFIDEIRDSDTGGMSHGGEFETALMLHLHPDLVDMESTPAEYRDAVYSTEANDLMESGSLSVYRPFTAYSESGAIGDPDLASAEKGTEIFERLGERLERVLKEVHAENK